MPSRSRLLPVVCNGIFFAFFSIAQNQPILMIFGTWNSEKILHQQFSGSAPWPVSCSDYLGKSKKSFFDNIIHTWSDYLCYLRIKQTATVTVQLSHNSLLTVTCTVLMRCVADARATASDPQHCWGRVCLPSRQCTSTLHLWHSRASALWGTSQQSWQIRLITASGAWCRNMYAKYKSTICTSCGSGLLRHGLNFSRSWWRMRLISGERTGSLYQCRWWSLWTLAVTLLASHSLIWTWWCTRCHTKSLADDLEMSTVSMQIQVLLSVSSAGKQAEALRKCVSS